MDRSTAACLGPTRPPLIGQRSTPPGCVDSAGTPDIRRSTLSDRSPRVASWWPALPYAIGALHLAAFHLLFRWQRGGFFGGDSGEYLAIAESLRTGTIFTQPANGKPLGYPLLLALASWLPGSDVAHALWLNAACWLLTIALVGGLVRRIAGSPRLALVAQLGVALIPNSAYWANLVLSDTVATALFVAAAWCLVRIETESDGRWPAIWLGITLGALALTRTEYVLLWAAALVWLAWGARDRARRGARGSLVVALGCSVPLLLIQPILTHRPGGVIPPNQSGALQFWASQFDLEFTQLRLFRLVDAVRLATSGEPVADATLAARVAALRDGHDPQDRIPDAALAQAEHELRALRDATSRGVPRDAAYRDRAVAMLQQHPWRTLGRALQRFILYASAAELEWPHGHRLHLLLTLALRPLAIAGYLAAGWWLLIARGAERRLAGVLALWAVFPIVVHAVFIYEQRFGYPAIPMLVVIVTLVWGRVGRKGKPFDELGGDYGETPTAGRTEG